MWYNRLQLNTAKTEVLWCASCRRQHEISQVLVCVGDDFVSPSTTVCDLGICLDCDASMKSHVSETVAKCFAALRQIHSVRRSVTRPVLLSLVSALVLSWLDYGSTMLAGLPTTQQTTVSAQYCCAAGALSTETWPCDAIATGATWLRMR